MALGARVLQQDHWLEELAQVSSPEEQRTFLRGRKHLHSPASVEQLYNEVVRLARVDLRQAAGLAQGARWLADYIKDEASLALSWRAVGHVSYLTGRHRKAVKAYEAAVEIYRRLHRDVDVGRTYSGALQSLIYLGMYPTAMLWARRARRLFEKHGDRLRLARLDLNVGNIYYRQDQFERALHFYTRANREFQRSGDPQDVAIALRNIAVCYISLNQFARALEVYLAARTHCERHNMMVLVAEADYNIAYLHYLRGQYTLAMQMYAAARQRSEQVGDTYHKALCDLDEAELSLEINLLEEAERLAERAHGSFKSLRMRYEAAKALTFLAIARTPAGHAGSALRMLRRARNLFHREHNRVWTALADLYHALVLFQCEDYAGARRDCLAALEFFRKSRLRTRTALCEVLLARLDARAGQLRTSSEHSRRALRLLRHAENPAIEYQAWFALGQIQELQGRQAAAYRSYAKAHEQLNSLRSQLRAEAKISFQQDKLMVYEKLVRLALTRSTPERRESAFAYIEQGKSRSLADLIAFRSPNLPGSTGGMSDQMDKARELQQELNWIQRRIELEGVQASRHSWNHIRNLRSRGKEVERQLLTILPNLWTADQDYANLQSAKIASADEIRSAMPASTMLVEYYVADGMLYAALLNHDMLDVVALTSVEQVRQQCALLQFQLSKFRLGDEYLRTFSDLLRTTTEHHLRALYLTLIAPLRDRLNVRRLVIVPHSFLHRLPFHALFDGERYLIDQFAVSYAPSASVFLLCCLKKPCRSRGATVMGIPDPHVPRIVDEVNAVAANLPNARVFLGRDATVEQLRRHAHDSRFLHIATHGHFRADNPMFSSVRLADANLSLFDLYELRLRSELVTLSGCGTGLNVVLGGDELVGLVRGLLYSGAESVLLTLWDVNDQSTAEFMKLFYFNRARTKDKSFAMRNAICDLRKSYPDVYHWAPFILIGKCF